MFDPLDFDHTRLKKKLERHRLLSFAVLTAERMAVHGWRLFFWCLLFSGLWMLGAPAMLGKAVEIITLFVFAGGAGFFLWHDVRLFRFPRRRDLDRRIEQESGLLHRPVSSLEDTLSNPDKAETRGLWIASKSWMIENIARLRKPSYRETLAQKDPYALRLAITLLFFTALMIAGSQSWERIKHGLMPLEFTQKAQADRIAVWITPPDYTSAKQIVLSGQKQPENQITIPEDSAIKVRVSGGLGTPSVVLGSQSIPLKYLGEKTYGYEGTVPNGTSIKITQMFMTQAAWDYSFITDDPPAIAMNGEPASLEDGQVRFPFTVFDDYGVRDITMKMRPDDSIVEAPVGEPTEETRSVISPPGKTYETTPLYDLSWHSWAGLPVIFEFSISDQKGQTATLPAIQYVLPERAFRHPVAQEIIALRKKLAWNATESGLEVSDALQNLLNDPAAFQYDRVVFLALRSASSRLYYNPPVDVAKDVIALLWNTALRVEDGNVSLAANNLRDAQRQLEEALQNPETKPEQLAQLMENLKGAMAEYMMEMQKEIQKRLAAGEIMAIPPEMLGAMMNPEALGSFLAEMEQRLRSGDKSAAQEMLSRLQKMMDSMGSAMGMQMPKDMKFMSQGINELQKLIDNQQKLLDQTLMQAGLATSRQMQDYGTVLPPVTELLKEWGLDDMPPPPSADPSTPAPEMSVNTQANKTEQDSLRFVLGQLMLDADEALGEIPENMSKAEMEMRDSAEALAGNKPGMSVPHQQKAIEYLKESMQQMSQQLMARMQQMGGISLGGVQYDPLGRPMGGEGKNPGPFPGSTVKIPDEGARKRVEEILDLLRQRSGELERPPEELEYYRRLLRQF